MSRKKQKIHSFVLIEIVVAMGLIMLLYACYFGAARALRKMDRAFTGDTRALQTVSNTIERLENKKRYGNNDIKRIFMDEFQKGGFAENSGVTPQIKQNADSSTLSFIRKNGKAVIEVKIKCRK